MQENLIGLGEIAQAAARIGTRIHRTPMHTSAQLGRMFGVRMHLKAELFQRTGSFKVRGLLNRILTLSEAERAQGLVSISAGNAGAAIAWGARQLGARATIVMPANAARTKIEATRAYGGEIVLTDEELLGTMQQIQRERDLCFVHPFDDLEVMAGHGTIGGEILDDVADVETVLVPVGGGGLIGGLSAALKLQRPEVQVIGVEPVGAPAMTLSLEQGSPARVERLDTIADGLAAPFAGAHTLRHVQRFVDRVVTVEDEAILEALRLLLTRTKLAAEPSGAAGLAALVAGAVDLAAGTRVVCVVSGGNLDRDVLRRLF